MSSNAAYVFRKRLLRVLFGFGVAAWLTFVLFPYLWMFITSIKPQAELYTARVRYWPSKPTFEGYGLLVATTKFPRYFLNSIIVTFGTVGLTALAATPAAYCFSRLDFRGKQKLLGSFLVSQMFPSVLLVLSLFFIMKNLGVLNTPIALILAYSSFALPFTTWLLTGFLNTIPMELDESAMLDGASRLTTFRKILFPLALPGIIAALTYVFILSWNEFIYALTFTSDARAQTLTVGLNSFMGEYMIRWDLLTAGGVLAAIPIICFFMVLQKNLIQGLTAGAVKG
jgi:multiple sugar transport system permease protein